MFFPQTAAAAEGRRTFMSCLKYLPSFLFGEKKGPYVFFFLLLLTLDCLECVGASRME